MKKSVLLLLFFSACGPLNEEKKITSKSDPISIGKRFVNDRPFRRKLLDNSLVNPENGYSQLRTQKYGPGKAWDSLEVWNPEARHLLDKSENPLPFSVFPEIDFETIDEEELRLIGKAAFDSFPVAIELQLESHIDDPERVGLWKNDGRIGGLVEVSRSSGTFIATTCSTCHAVNKNSKLTYGLANSDLNYGAITGADWSHGTVDVTPDEKFNPTSIPDIRPIRFQNFLHWSATLKNNLGALAVRIETLLITSLSQRLRPPRGVSFALAYYFWTLGETNIGLTEMQAEAEPGYRHFKTHCSSCHFLDGTTAAPVDLEVIGTADAVGLSSRGTGKYRIPSLMGVAMRGRFLHDASVASLEEMFLTTRLEEAPGHVFGMALSDVERKELLDFLKLL